MTDTNPIPVPTAPAADSVPTVNNAATNRLLWIGAGFAALVVVSSVVLGLGEKPETKMSLFKWAVVTGGGVLASALAAAGYSVGKLFEGVTPIGFTPAAKVVAQVVNTPAVIPPLVPTAIPDAGRDPNLAPRSITGGLLVLLFAPLLAFSAFGCAGTSAQFKGAVPAGVNNVVQDMREYTAAHDWDTNHNGTVEPAEAAQRTEENTLTDNLAASVADEAKITVEGVEKAWRPVEPRWRAYVANDPLIAGDAESQKIRNDTGDLINKLIQVEKERQAAVRQSIPLVGGIGK